MKQTVILPVTANSQSAVANETTARAWQEAQTKYDAVRRAVVAHIDGPSDAALDSHPQPHIDGLRPQKPDEKPNLVSMMKSRALLLADALHRRAISRIIETGSVLDEIDRAARRIPQTRRAHLAPDDEQSEGMNRDDQHP